MMADSAKQPTILDGALGTELERRGFDARLPLWSAQALLDAPELVKAIHADYVRAGADVLTAATFRTSRYTLAKAGLEKGAEELAAVAVQLARDAILDCRRDGSVTAARAEEILVAASIAPLEDCYHPERRPPDDVLIREHTHTAKALKRAGANLLLVETQSSAREAQLATECALNTELPVWTSLMASTATTLLSGDSLVDAALAAYALGVDAVLVNCCPPAVAEAALRTLRAALPAGDVRLGAYPNFSSGEGQPWEFDAPLSVEEFAAWGRRVAPDAAIVGGCCGTTPAHIATLARALADARDSLEP